MYSPMSNSETYVLLLLFDAEGVSIRLGLSKPNSDLDAIPSSSSFSLLALVAREESVTKIVSDVHFLSRLPNTA